MIERIVTDKDLNNFMINFQSTNTIEELQKLSGMEGAYKVEYQAHFINLVGTINTGDQRLMFGIPMAFYNYHQEVSGASVEFNLGEVGESNNAAMKTAIEKFNEFETTDMYKALVEYGVVDWQLVGLNSLHCHPMGVNGFSGTDYRADIKHPGVCYPLSVGENIPNIAMMMQHRSNYAELILAEVTNFNGKEKGERHYAQGRCLTINRGVPQEPEVDYVELPQGLIDDIFGTKRPQPPKPAPAKVRENFILKSNFHDGNKEKVESFSEEMMKLWTECEFQIDMSNVLKTNVSRGRGRLQQTTTWGGHGGKPQGRSSRNLEEMNEGLFGEWYERYHGTKTIKPIKDDKEYFEETEPTYVEAIAYILSTGGYTEAQLRSEYTYKELIDLYWEEKLDAYDEYDVIDDWEKRKQYTFGEEVVYEGVTYTMNNEKNDIISVTPPDIAIGIWEPSGELAEGDYDGALADGIMVSQLEDMNIMSKEKLNMLSSEDLAILHDEIFG